MNEGFSRLLQRADCHKNAPHRNASSPTRTAARHRCGTVSRFVFRPARRDKKPIQTGEFPRSGCSAATKMPRTAMRNKSREK